MNVNGFESKAVGGRRAFTLVELLIVIAIILVLIALFLPTIRDALEKGRRVYCGNNMHQLTVAAITYSQEHGGRLVGGNTYSAASNDWVLAQNTMDSLTKGSIWPYVRDARVYRCPSYPPAFRHYLRHFSVNGYLRGESKAYLERDAIMKYDLIPSPSGTFYFCEEVDPRNYLVNSFAVYLTGYRWVDIVAYQHKGANFTFADGHQEFRRWKDARTSQGLTFYRTHPNNPDWRWVSTRACPGSDKAPEVFSDY